MNDRRVLVLGGGLAGLSAARALRARGAETLLLEAEDRIGGLCRTERAGGFAFDYTGHLLHLRDGSVKDLVLGLLGSRLREHRRRASIFISGTYVPYPIQANFGRLPPPLPRRCIEDFRAAQGRPTQVDMGFDLWSRAQFGDALAELFMLPYNRKLFLHPISEMEVGWTSWSVPRPTADQMERAARGEDTGSFGYNATFLYPREGGIEILPAALAEAMEESVLTGAAVSSVDTGRKVVLLSDSRELSYTTLISTVPLPNLLRMTAGLPAGMSSAGSRFRYSSVLGLCLGLDREAVRPEHWIYFPEEGFPFYRVGFPTNFSADVAPPGCSSIYAEVSHLPAENPDPDALTAETLSLLKAHGIVHPQASVLARLALPIPCAYVFYDRHRSETLPVLLADLRQRSIISIGRYGSWEYSSMQDAIAQGLDAAREVAI